MNCPTCGNEAINVNGKYVCLECGVELPGSTPPAPTTSAVNNHLIGNDDEIPVAAASNIAPREKVIAPPPSSTVKDNFLRELDEMSEPGMGSQASQTTREIPDFPTAPATPQAVSQPAVAANDELASIPPTISEPLPLETAPAVKVPVEAESPVVAEPSAPAQNPFLGVPGLSVPEAEPSKATGFDDSQSAPRPQFPVEPDLPTTEPKVATEPIEEKLEAPLAAPAPQPPVDSSPAVPSEPVTDPFDSLINENKDGSATPNISEIANLEQKPSTEEAVPETITPPVVGIDPASPQSYFQPATLEIGSNGMASEAIASANTPDVLPTTPDPVVAEVPAPLTPPVVGTGGFVDSVRPAQYQATTTPPSAPAGGLPSVESVFNNPASVPATSPLSKFKMSKGLLIGLIAGGAALLLLIGIIITLTVSSKGKTLQKSEIESAVVTQVPAKIDQPQELRVTYKQQLNFSGLSLKEGASPEIEKQLQALKDSAYTKEGSWQTNITGDIAVEIKGKEGAFSKTYVAAEKTTYVYEGTNLNKVEGRELSGVPSIFNPVERGGLFYSSNLSSLSHQKTFQDEEKKTFYEFKLMPKPEFVQTLLTETSTVFSAAKIADLNASGLNLVVQTDENYNLYRISVNGEVIIDSDLFSGVVNFQGNAIYSYEAS